MRFNPIILITVLIIAVSCSGSGNPVTPDTTDITPGTDVSERVLTTSDSHHCWGLWQFAADPDAGTLEVTPLRSALMHVNVVPLLEPPMGAKLKIGNLVFDDLICNVDVTLIHPFPGLSEYIGFDVTGVFISDGTMGGFHDPDLLMAGDGETRLLNPDGLTRWWNPDEFGIPGPPIFRYKDGLMGNPDSMGNYSCTLNGYKLFCDDLGPEDPVLALDPNSRVTFTDGYANTRHYTIDFAGGVVFNYAVDANWEPPEGLPPYYPDDFIPEANRPEAWAISVTELENSLWNDGNASGGALSLMIDVWDHYNAGDNILWTESPGAFDYTTGYQTGGMDSYSTYQVDIVDVSPPFETMDIMIGVESEAIGYHDVLPDNPITAYFTYTVEVGSEPGNPPTAIMEATSGTTIFAGQTVSFDASASTGSQPLTFTWDFNGDDIYDGPEDTYTGDSATPEHQFDDEGTFDVTVKVTNPIGEDISEPVEINVLPALDPNDTYVDADYTGGDSDGTMEKPFLTVQEGMAAVDPYQKVHVDYCDGGDNIYYTSGLTLKSDVTLLGDNWNGGGPGKPILKNTSGIHTISWTSTLNNFTLDGFEIGMGEQAGNSSNYGIYLSTYSSNMDSITIRHCQFTDSIDDTGKTSGVGIPISMRGCSNSLIEFNEIGPLTWESETPGVYARVLWSGMYLQYCDNIEVKNNFIHDTTVDYDGDASWGQIRVFGIHCYTCNPADVHNNLICHIKGINDYDYRIEAMMMEGYSGTQEYHYYNNTIDSFDHSTSNGGFSLRGIFIYANSATDTDINNTIMTNFTPGGYSSVQAYFSSPSYLYDISYSTGYSLGSITDYFYNLNEGDGITNYPGIDPKYVNNTTEPYDYTFQSGSGCEMGDPNFIDWDDTGTPSGDPDETNEENRSRMGCFGGPDGDWDPYDL